MSVNDVVKSFAFSGVCCGWVSDWRVRTVGVDLAGVVPRDNF